MMSGRGAKPERSHDATSEPGPKALAPVDGVLLLDRRMDVVAADHNAEAIIRALEATHPTGNVLRYLGDELRKHQIGHGGGPKSSRLRLSAAHHDYRCHAFLVEPRGTRHGEAFLAVYLRREVSLDEAVQRVAAAYHVTDREREALIGVAMGLTSKELALRMNISPNTVNAFFRLIMSKMGVTTRAGVVGKLLEQLDVPQDY